MGPDLRTTEKIEKKKSPTPAEFEPTTFLLQGVRSTAVLQPLPRVPQILMMVQRFQTNAELIDWYPGSSVKRMWRDVERLAGLAEHKQVGMKC